jgi:hypothetical protein
MMKIKLLRIFKDDGNNFLEKPMWMCFCGDYFYSAYSFWGLMWQIITEFKHPRHLIG